MASTVSQYLGKLLFWKKKDLSPSVAPESLYVTNKWENYVSSVEKILTWEDPVLSSLTLVLVNVVFWLLVHLECKLYGLIFSAILTVFLYEVWSEYVWPEVVRETGSDVRGASAYSSQYRARQATELRRYLGKVREVSKQACDKMRKLREEQPGAFCAAMCCCFLCISVIGRSISGLMLLYTLLMLVMTLPGFLLHKVPAYKLSAFLNTYMYSSQTEYEVEVEYLPEASHETMELLHLAGDLQLPSKDREDYDEDTDFLLEQMSSRTNDTAESSASKLSFCPDASQMPSHENSLDCLEAEFELSRKLLKSDSEESDPCDIQFQNKHFNGDSSDEEEEFSRGLRFKDKDEVDSKKQQDWPDTGVGRKLLTMGANILSTVVSGAATAATVATAPEREPSSDTDSFELISEDDI